MKSSNLLQLFSETEKKRTVSRAFLRGIEPGASACEEEFASTKPTDIMLRSAVFWKS